MVGFRSRPLAKGGKNDSINGRKKGQQHGFPRLLEDREMKESDSRKINKDDDKAIERWNQIGAENLPDTQGLVGRGVRQQEE